MELFRGTGVALVTPFAEDGSVDFEGLKRLLEFTAEGVDYYVVMGTTGESATLTAQEKTSVLDFVKTNNTKNLPIVYGIGGNNTAQVIETIRTSDLNGVEAILSVSPYYNKPSQAGIIAHYQAIADVSPRPIILYNVPGRTMSNLTAATTIELSKHPNIIGIKEASGNLNQIKAIHDQTSDDFFITSGDDLLTSDIIEIGGIGAISVLANGFPVEFSRVSDTALQDDFTESKAICASFETTNSMMFEESNPVGIKEVLRQKGICGGQVRLPLLPASAQLRGKIAQNLKLWT